MPDPIRILFIGELYSSHAQSWIDLLSSCADKFFVQGVSLCAMPRDPAFFVRRGGPAPASLAMRILRRCLCMRYKTWADPIRSVYAYGPPEVEFHGLVKSLRQFNPHIVHTFGFTPAALIYGSLPVRFRAGRRWVLQTRGGSDVAFTHLDPAWRALFRRWLPEADIVLCDNTENYRIFAELGILVRRDANLSFVPGTGGLDLAGLPTPKALEERERLLLWNKAYESPWSKALPVLEGLRLAWNRIAPVRCVFTAVDAEVRAHVRLLPAAMRDQIELRNRLPRSEMLDLMRETQVVLAPSLVDGIPNTLYEAMAAGAIPVVSPLAGIIPHFMEGSNVFYARNLYPTEIAEALVRAFVSPLRVAMVHANRTLVLKMADRARIAGDIAAMYKKLTT